MLLDTRSRSLAPLFGAGLGLALLAAPATGQRPQEGTQVQLVGLYQAAADLDGGGDLAVSRAAVSVSHRWSLDARSGLSARIGYGVDDYAFGDLGEATAPWDRIHSFELGMGYSRQLENGWSLFAEPSIRSDAEGGIDTDALTYGLIAGANTRLSETLQIGLGVFARHGLEETRVLPILSIRWQFAERWALQNPTRPGPSSPAGLELAYTGDTWSASAGVAYRSWRFQIDGAGESADGIAEYEGAPLYVRYTLALSEGIGLDLYAGAIVGGSLEVEDSHGHRLGDEVDLDTAPFAGLALSGRF